VKDDLLSRLASVTGQMRDIETDRDELSTRLEQLRKVLQEVEEGIVSVMLTFHRLLD